MRSIHKFGVSLSLLCAVVIITARPAFSQLQEITIGLPSTTLATALPRVAREIGIFAKYGLDPKFVAMENGAVAAAALISGSIKLTLAGPGEIIVAQASGQKVLAVATTYAGQSATLVISKAVADKLGVSPDAPIAQRLKALDGLVIAGTSPTAVAAIAYRGAAKAAGADMRSTNISQPSMPAALESGAVQGFFASAPIWISPVTKGTGVAWIVGPRGDLPPDSSPVASGVMLAMRDYADANPDLIKRITAVLAEVGPALEQRPADVVAALVKLYPDLDKKTIEVFLTAEFKAWHVKPPTAQDMAREIEFLKKSGVSQLPLDKLDPSAMVYP